MESPSFQDSFLDPDHRLPSSIKQSNEKMNHIQPNDTFQAGYYAQNHPSFMDKQFFTNQLFGEEQSFDQNYFQEDEQIHEGLEEDDEQQGQGQQYLQEQEEEQYQNIEDKSDQTITDCLPDNFFEQLRPQQRVYSYRNKDDQDQLNRDNSVKENARFDRSTSLKKKIENKNDDLLYARAAKIQMCQNLVQQQIDKEIQYMSNSKKMSQVSYRIVAKKLENEIEAKMKEIDPQCTKIITFSQLGRLLQLLNLFTVVKFDANSQMIVEEYTDPQRQLRFAQEVNLLCLANNDQKLIFNIIFIKKQIQNNSKQLKQQTMFHQQLWFLIVNYLNKRSVLGEIVFSTLRILMDPMQLSINGTKSFLAQYMGRTLSYLEEDRKAAQENTHSFQLWTLDQIVRAFRQLNQSKILREKSLNINNSNTNNKKQPLSKELDKSIYTFKPNIDKNSLIIDEKHKKKFNEMNQSNKMNISPIRHSLATQNTKSTQSTKKLINLLSSSQSNQNLHSHYQNQQQFQNGQNPTMVNGPTLNQSSNSSNMSFLNAPYTNSVTNPNAINNNNNLRYSQQNESNLLTNVTNDYRNSTLNTEFTNSIIEQHPAHYTNERLKQKSLMSHSSRTNLNVNNNNKGSINGNQYISQQGTIRQSGDCSSFREEDGGNMNQMLKIKRCETTLNSFLIPEEEGYYDDISSNIHSQNCDKSVDRVNMMLQKKVQTDKKISTLKEQLIQKQMKECTFQPQIQRSVSPQYSAYNRNQKDIVSRQQSDINKRSQALTHRNQLKQEEELKQLSQCTFQPSLSPTIRNQTASKSPKTPKGFDQTVYRMRAANEIQKANTKQPEQGSYVRASIQKKSKNSADQNPDLTQNQNTKVNQRQPINEQQYQSQTNLSQQLQQQQLYQLRLSQQQQQQQQLQPKLSQQLQQQQPQQYLQQEQKKESPFQSYQQQQTQPNYSNQYQYQQQQQLNQKQQQNQYQNYQSDEQQEYELTEQKQYSQNESDQQQQQVQQSIIKQEKSMNQSVRQSKQKDSNTFDQSQYQQENQPVNNQDTYIYNQLEQQQQDIPIIQKPKQKPFFVLDIITPLGEKVFLDLYRNDDVHEKADAFSKQYNLDEITASKIEQILDQQMTKYLSRKSNNLKNIS